MHKQERIKLCHLFREVDLIYQRELKQLARLGLGCLNKQTSAFDSGRFETTPCSRDAHPNRSKKNPQKSKRWNKENENQAENQLSSPPKPARVIRNKPAGKEACKSQRPALNPSLPLQPPPGAEPQVASVGRR